LFLVFLLNYRDDYFYYEKQSSYFCPQIILVSAAHAFGGKAAAFALPSHLCSPIIFDIYWLWWPR
jgi:hypothetical protein